MWSHSLGCEAASNLPESTLTGSLTLPFLSLQTRRHLAENPAKGAKPESSCSQIMDRRLARIRWVKGVALPGFVRLLKPRACVEQMIPWPPLCPAYTHTQSHRVVRRLRSGQRGNCAGYDASPINRGAGEAFFFLHSFALSPPRARTTIADKLLRPSLAGAHSRQGNQARDARRATAPPILTFLLPDSQVRSPFPPRPSSCSSRHG